MKVSRINSIVLFSFVFGYMLFIPFWENFEVDYIILKTSVFNVLPLLFTITLFFFYLRFFKYKEGKIKLKNKAFIYIIWYTLSFSLILDMPIYSTSLYIAFSYGLLIFLFMFSVFFDMWIWMGRKEEIFKS